LPNGFELDDGNSSGKTIGEMIALETNTSTIFLTVLNSAEAGVVSVITDVNSTSDSSDQEIISIIIGCTSGDSICGNGCTQEVDTDCAEDVVTTGGSSGGGGRGGGSSIPARRGETVETVHFSFIGEIYSGDLLGK